MDRAYRNPGYLVWNPERGLPSVPHPTEDSARSEAKRLAAANKGQRFYVMHARGWFEEPAPAPKWTPIDPKEIEDWVPF